MDNGNNGRRNSNSGILAILFDLDNTLIATRKADKLACNKLAQILSEKWEFSLEFAKEACKSYLKTFRNCPEDYSMNLEKWRHLLWTQALGEQHKNLADEVYRTWLKLRYDYLSLTPEIQSLLVKLRKHYFVGLITNGTSRAQWEKVERLDLAPFFDVILVSGDLPWEKPHREIFIRACNFLGVVPQQCLMVGDKLETDILGGIRANLGATVWVPLSSSSEMVEDYNPDFVIKSVMELPKILPKNPKVPRFRRNGELFGRKWMSGPDLDDGNSNSSDGS